MDLNETENKKPDDFCLFVHDFHLQGRLETFEFRFVEF